MAPAVLDSQNPGPTSSLPGPRDTMGLVSSRSLSDISKTRDSLNRSIEAERSRGGPNLFGQTGIGMMTEGIQKGDMSMIGKGAAYQIAAPSFWTAAVLADRMMGLPAARSEENIDYFPNIT